LWNLGHYELSSIDRMKKALITEDDLVSNLLLSALIRDQGFSTVSAYSLDETRKHLEAEVFNIIFLDNKLPDGLGIDFIPSIKLRQTQAVLVIMSAEDFEDNVKRAYALGADVFLPKPLSHTEIKRVLGMTE
jgi:two-component system, OmpR family, response regulator